MAVATAADSSFCLPPTTAFGLRISFHWPLKLESFDCDELIRCCDDALPIETQGGEPFAGHLRSCETR